MSKRFLLVLGLVLVAACATGPRPGSLEEEDPGASRSAVNFSLRDIKGRKLRLKDFRDKVVAISFWATWCNPCLTELPVLQAIWDRNRPKGFELISINVDSADGESEVRETVAKYGYRFPVLLDQQTQVINRFNPTMDLPFLLLLDRTGRVLSVHQGYQPGDERILEGEIQEALGLKVP